MAHKGKNNTKSPGGPYAYTTLILQNDATTTTGNSKNFRCLRLGDAALTVSLWDDRFCRGTQNNVTLKPFRYPRGTETQAQKFENGHCFAIKATCEHKKTGKLNNNEVWATHQNNQKQNATASRIFGNRTRIPLQATYHSELLRWSSWTFGVRDPVSSFKLQT